MEHEYKDIYKPLDLNAKKDDYFLQICCPKCASEVAAKNIDLSEKMAKCDSCNAIFSVKNEIVSLQSYEPTEIIPKPVGVDILEYNDELELTLSQPVSVFYIIAMSLFPLFTLIFLGLFFKNGEPWAIYPGAASLFVFVFSLVKIIRSRRDKIYVTVDDKELIVEYRPNNFISDKAYQTDSIEQLFVKKDANGLHLSMLVNEVDGQKAQILIGRFSDITKAKYVEQEIERYLGIKNRKVAGEEL